MKIGNLNYSTGNSKLGNVLNFSLQAVTTCPINCIFCYAKKGFHNFPNVKKVRRENTEYIMKMEKMGQLKYVAEEIIGVIKLFKPKMFRVHESGDFYSEDYAKMWYYIMSQCPEVDFNVFTKAFKVIKKVPFYSLQNAHLFLSAMPGLEIPEDLKQYYKIAWLKDKKCLETRIPSRVFMCPGKSKKCEFCRYCFRNGVMDVCFNEH